MEFVLTQTPRYLPTQRCVNKDGAVEFGRCVGNVDRLHLLEAPQRVALAAELPDLSLVEGTGDEEDDVVYHVAVPVGGGKTVHGNF